MKPNPPQVAYPSHAVDTFEPTTIVNGPIPDTELDPTREPTLSPSSPIAAQLIQLGETGATNIYRIGECITIGRTGKCNVQLLASDISRLHARITRSGSARFYIEDLKSKNGTRVNGTRVDKLQLADGDVVRFGASVAFVFARVDPLQDNIAKQYRLDSVTKASAAVAREFSDSLAVIKASLELIDELPSTHELSDDAVQDLLAEAKTAARLGSKLASKFDWTTRPPDLAMSDAVCVLGDVVHEALQSVLNILTKVTLDYDFGDVPPIAMPAALLRETFLSLVHNACEAMPHGGALRIVARAIEPKAPLTNTTPMLPPRPYVVFTVSDTGVGIAPHLLQRLFEPYVTTKHSEPATGLSLATAFHAVRKTGGGMQVETTPGRGTAFALYIPAATLG